MRVLRSLLIALILLCSSLTTWASYTPPTTDELLFGSEIVVYGEIVSLTETHYTLRAERFVRVGALTAEKDTLVEVRRFEDWTCAQRGQPYAVGERLLPLTLDDLRKRIRKLRRKPNEGEDD